MGQDNSKRQGRQTQRSILRYGLFDDRGSIHTLNSAERIVTELGIDMSEFSVIQTEICALLNRCQNMKKNNPARQPLDKSHKQLQNATKLLITSRDCLEISNSYSKQLVS